MLKGEQAGTTLRASLIRLASPTKASQKAMDQLGISLTDSKGKFVGMPKLIGQFENGLKGMSKEQKLAAVSQIVGTESASGFLAMIDAGPGKLSKYSNALKNSDGASKEAADKMNNTLKGAIEQLGGAFESLAIKITQSNGGPLTTLIRKLGDIVAWFSRLPGPVIQTITIFAGLAAAIGPVLVMLGATANGITSIASAVTLLNGTKGGAAFFSIFKGGLGSILPNIGQLLTKIPILGGLFSVLGGALGAISAPVWIVIGAVAALGTAFVIAYKKSETFRNIVNAVINPVKNAITSLWNGIKAFATGIKNVFSGDTAGGFNIFKKLLPKEAATQLTSTLLMIRGAFRDFFTFIRTTSAIFGSVMSAFWRQHGSTIINTFNAIKSGVGIILSVLFNNVIKPILAGIGNNFRIIFGGLKAVVINVFTGIRMVVQGGLTAIGGIINIFKGLFTGNFRLMWQGIKQVFSGALTAIGGMLRLTFGNLLIFIRTIGLMMLNSFKAIWTIIKNVVVGLAKALAFSVRATITVLKTVLIAIFTALSVAVRNIWNGLKNAVLSIVRALISGIRALFNGLKVVLTNIWNGIKAISLRVWTAIKNGVIAIVRGYANTVKSIFNSLKSAISFIFNSIKNFFIRVWTTVKNSVVSIVRALYNNLKNHFNNLKNIIHSIFNAIKNFLYSIWTSIKNRISQLVQNIRDSVANKFNSLKRAVVDITSRLKGYLVNSWNTIKSKITGLAQGLKDKVVGTFNKMKDGLSNIIGKIKGFIGGMVDAVKKGLNKLIDGVNWVAGKIGMDKIPKLKLSTGTESTHTQNYVTNGKINRDTFATVGDKGKGNGPGGFRHEMIRYPNGKTAITPNRDTTAYLPKGSTVYNGAQTHAMLNNGIPEFSIGSMFGKMVGGLNATGKKATTKVVDTGKNIAKGAGNIAKGALDAIGDVMEYMDNPGKLVDKVLGAVGFNFDFLKGDLLGSMMKAMVKKLKGGVKDLFAGWLEDSGGGDGSQLMRYPIIQRFGRYTGGLMFNGGKHYGVDFQYPYGANVYATNNGVVSGINDYGGGLIARLITGQFTLFFMHLSKILKTGKVKTGDLIAKSGNSGHFTTGPHLHFQVNRGHDSYVNNSHAIEPLAWLKGHGGGGKSGKWNGNIRQALKLAGLPTSSSYVSAWQRQIQTESGGNASAIGGTDGLADGRAKGLVQVKPGTFNAYKLPGHGNIMNGLDNLIAGMRYAKARYGGSMLGVIGHGHGYATGGLINSSGWYNLAEEGHGEYIVPRDPRRASDAMKIIALASNEIQGNKKGNKRPGQLPNINTGGTDNTELLLQMIENQQVQISQQQEQMNALMAIARKELKVELDGREMNRNNNQQQALNMQTQLMRR